MQLVDYFEVDFFADFNFVFCNMTSRKLQDFIVFYWPNKKSVGFEVLFGFDNLVIFIKYDNVDRKIKAQSVDPKARQKHHGEWFFLAN